MKKIIAAVFMLVLGGFLVVGLPKFVVQADENVEYLDGVVEISEDTVYSNVNFVVSSTTNMDKNFNILSGTVVLNDCHISASSTAVMDSVFVVGESAKLILNNVTIENINYNKCISNAGVVNITNTTFVDNRTSIENNSSKENSINYYSGTLETVNLKSGYISVYENTVIESPIKLVVSSVRDRTLVVKSVGENVFANKYFDKFSYNGSGYVLDYIGDGATVKDASGNIDLRSGDVVLIDPTMSFGLNENDEIMYSAQYCTSHNFLKTNEILYYSNKLARTMDNYTANTDGTARYTVKSSENNLFTVNINSVTRSGSGDTVVSSKKVTYLAGSNHAVFVDIPEGYEFDNEDDGSIELLEGAVSTNIISVSDNLYSNSCYLRPIILTDVVNTETKNFTVNFIFKEKVKYAIVNLTENYGVTLVNANDIVVGSETTFVVNCAEDEVISAIKFNGETVTFNKTAAGYTFTAVALENNVIDTEIKHIITITPSPSKLAFEYGDAIELKQSYTVAKTGEVLKIEYMPTGMDIGSYSITEVKSCDKDNYIINIAGDVKYTVGKKQVDISTIETKVYRVSYSQNIVLSYENFLVNSLPNYLNAELQHISEFVGGEQTLRINFTVKDSERFVIAGEKNYISVVLDIVALEINVNTFVLNDTTSEYTGSKIEVLASGYDATAVEVRSIYYLPSDPTTPVEPINVGTYTVKLDVTAKSSVYIVVGSKTATLTITAKNIDLSAYITAIELTEFTYDGESKYIDLKEDLLPDNITLSVDSNEEPSAAGIYYYTVSFDPVSNNYTCIDSCRVSLVINAKIVTINLATTVFNYTGNIPNLVVNIIGVIGSDVVTAVFETVPVSTVGTHKIMVLRLSNTNYALENPVELEYTINSIAVDMSSVEFNNITTTYDGLQHKPVLTGTLPLGISYNISTTDNCTSAGVHNVKCTFVSNNEGIIAPAPMFATVTIAQKEIIVVYTEPTNMVSNGVKKSMIIEFIGLIEGETVNYETIYSAEPILAGEYTCKVKLVDETNYVLKSDAPYRFIVFMSSINYNEDGLNLNVKGKFSSKENLTISKVNTKVEIVNLVSNLEVKDYLAINMSCVNYQDEPMTVTIDVRDITEELKYLKVYRVKDNKLESVDYTGTGSIITFVSNCNEEIIFVEEYSFVYIHRVEINIIVICAISCLILTAVICVLSNKSKKKINK